MEIRRERDAELMNRVANHPDVVGHIHVEGQPTDWSDMFAYRSGASGLVAVSDGECAFAVFELVDATDPFAQVFQGHTVFAPPCRGARALATGRAMLRWMFQRNAGEVWGATPTANRRARMFNRLLGAETVPELSDEDEEVFVFRRAAWLRAQDGQAD